MERVKHKAELFVIKSTSKVTVTSVLLETGSFWVPSGLPQHLEDKSASILYYSHSLGASSVRIT